MQDEKKYGAVIDNYITIEETLTFLLKYIPYLKENKIVYSPKFIPLIIDTCGLIESIFLDILDLKHTTRKTFLNYSKLIQNEINIENTISILLDTPFGFLMPFKNWTRCIPSWWNVYNKLKHDRVNNFHKATLEVTVNSICGLHQIIAKNPLLTIYLAALGYLNQESDEFINLLENSSFSSLNNPVALTTSLPFETRLFVSPGDDDIVSYSGHDFIISDSIDFSHSVWSKICVNEFFLL